jgi:transposase
LQPRARAAGQTSAGHRAYDANTLHDIILDQSWDPVIAPHRHRNHQHANDRIAYKQRGSESFFAKLKQWRRIATRYDKLAANFLGFIS